VVDSPNNPRITLHTLVILVSWEIWCERNAGIFRNAAGIHPRQDQGEGRAWVKAGAFKLQDIEILGDIT
jgi:hypothetical protein